VRPPESTCCQDLPTGVPERTIDPDESPVFRFLRVVAIRILSASSNAGQLVRSERTDYLRIPRSVPVGACRRHLTVET